ncbi:putative proline dehydrogenase, mitochondrial [Botryosphaeria dothidea]|uniref:Proline dehydrogenase n=1 Tax=Botryosphaeria dothidea TaxID=55169 RepID=A0A8H4IJD5_9PEZI|nr:putative proline dehydrogenase, mitochondrial [Botryosphaeria dothidea]
MLLRSVCINSVSSKPLLLNPALSILSALCKPNRGFLLNVDRNPLLHSILKGTFYKQFCAGETAPEVTATIRHMRKMGFRGTILTYAKETVFDHATNTSHGLGVASTDDGGGVETCENIAAWAEGTLKTVDLLEEGDQLALKLTGAGPLANAHFTAGALPPPQLLDALHEICRRSAARGARVVIDAESQHFQAGIARAGLELMRAYNRDGRALVYNTYQAYLKATPAVLAQHLRAAKQDGFTLGLKLVRGAYLASDERGLIHDSKAATDAAYDGIAGGALRRQIGEFEAEAFPGVELILASHNRASVVRAHELHRQRVREGLPTVPVAFAQLHGMSDEVSFGLLQLGAEGGEGVKPPEVYKCSTWGSLGECLAYLMRRAAENRDAAARTAEEYAALKAEVRRRAAAWLSPSRWFGAR